MRPPLPRNPSSSRRACKHPRSDVVPFAAVSSEAGRGRFLTDMDMPMGTPLPQCDTDELTTKGPWDEGLKNLYSDYTSIKTASASAWYDCYVFMEGPVPYDFSQLDRWLRRSPFGTPPALIVRVRPASQEAGERSSQFVVSSRPGDKRHWTVSHTEPRFLAETILAHLEGTSVMVCIHDARDEYLECMDLFAGVTWSIPCTPGWYVDTDDDFSGGCRRFCQIYSHPRSLETRALGTGRPVVGEGQAPFAYIHRLGFYNSCVRTARYPGGQCYDCTRLELMKADMKGSKSQRVADKSHGINITQDAIVSLYSSV